jgi:hypothetical protein
VQIFKKPSISLLLVVNLLAGLLTFRDYGQSWDEPLFYDYADALGYAYSPREWLSGNFDLEKAFGSSASDHANRGPAYLLLARAPAGLLEAAGMDPPAAWHLVNFITFQLGVYLFYRLSRRWMEVPAAVTSAALFAWQPLLWGHAFINPKDPPFLVFFLGAVCFGFELVDEIARGGRAAGRRLLLAGFFLGIATSIRVLGPLAGLITVLYGLWRVRHTSPQVWLKTLVAYVAVSLAIAFATWPYLWEDPLRKFIAAFGFMSDNPTHLPVLFDGLVYRADGLPRRYLPLLLGYSLSEPVWPLAILGGAATVLGFRKDRSSSPALLTVWFIIPFAYVLLRRPPMYDGYRHFLFILPPVFVFCGVAIQHLLAGIRRPWTRFGFLLLILVPALPGLVQLHPYQYAYYNSFAGGTGGAFRRYETEYWLTCYKEAIEELQGRATEPATVFVNREAHIARAYAGEQLTVLDRRGAGGQIMPGDLFLVNTRTNEDQRFFREAPMVLEVGRAGAVFCKIKRIPPE